MRPSLFAPCLALLLAAGASAQELPSADGFEREVLKTLKASHANRRGITVHVGGTTVSGVVSAIGPDVIVLGNRERARILVRRERIDAVQADE